MNTTVSSAVADALYNMSDHLPVVASFNISPSNVVSVSELNEASSYKVNNPIRDLMMIQKESGNFKNAEFQIVDINGRIIYNQRLFNTSVERINVANFKRGTYILRLFEDGYLVKNEKLIMI